MSQVMTTASPKQTRTTNTAKTAIQTTKASSQTTKIGTVKNTSKMPPRISTRPRPAQPSVSAPSTKSDKPIGTATVSVSALNVRAEPNVSAARIGGVIKGQSLSYYEAKDGWLKIAYASTFGWVAAKYTSYKDETTQPENPSPNPEPENPSPDPEPEKPSTTFKVKVTPTDGLNVRTGPGTGFDKIGALEQNTIVEVLDEQNGWYKINYNGQNGWISAQYTEKTDGSTPSQPETPTTEKKVVTTDALNLRDIPGNGSTPAAGSNILVLIPSGTTLTVQAEQNGWYKVSYNGQTGWCCAAYTSTVPTPSGNALADLQKVIDKARSFVRPLHHPYVWGGKGQILTKSLISSLSAQYGASKYASINANPDYFNGNYRAFDCSGLCCWCYKNVLGKDISEGYGWQPQASKAVFTAGSNVTQAQLQIGDVIVSPGHFVMYRGEGKAVESCGSYGLADTLAWNRNGVSAVYRYLV